MEAEGGSGCNDEKNNVIRRLRSNIVRRPRSDLHSLFDAPHADHVPECQKSSANVFHLSNPSSLSRGVNKAGNDTFGNKSGKDDSSYQATGNVDKRGSCGNVTGSRRATKGVLSSAIGKRQCDEKVTLKIKVSGSDGSSPKSSHLSDGSHRRQKLNSQDSSDLKSSSFQNANERVSVPNDCFKGRMSEQTGSTKKMDQIVEPARKSKRVPKKRVLDEAFDEEEDHYLVKRKTISRQNSNKEEDDQKQKVSEIILGNHGDVGGCEYPRKAMRSQKLSQKRSTKGADHVENNKNFESVDSDDAVGTKRTRPKKEYLGDSSNERKETSLTARQRALQSSRDASADPGSNVLEFPNGLPPPLPKDQKLSEVEKKLKQAEAAERRKIKSEKAAKEIEAEIIKRILGQDSNQNKKASKEQKRREEMAKMKAANAAQLAATTVRWVIAPTGTVVSFPEGMDLPSIFDSKPCSYPPPREKCAGPSCANPYKYRDSKSNLPLCSLECYRSVNGIFKPDTISS